MRLFDGYEIRGLDIRTINIGTSTKPHLYSITAGQRNSKSLIFHIKIENDFHQCHLARVNSTSVNFAPILNLTLFDQNELAEDEGELVVATTVLVGNAPVLNLTLFDQDSVVENTVLTEAVPTVLNEPVTEKTFRSMTTRSMR